MGHLHLHLYSQVAHPPPDRSFFTAIGGECTAIRDQKVSAEACAKSAEICAEVTPSAVAIEESVGSFEESVVDLSRKAVRDALPCATTRA